MIILFCVSTKKHIFFHLTYFFLLTIDLGIDSIMFEVQNKLISSKHIFKCFPCTTFYSHWQKEKKITEFKNKIWQKSKYYILYVFGAGSILLLF